MNAFSAQGLDGAVVFPLPVPLPPNYAPGVPQAPRSSMTFGNPYSPYSAGNPNAQVPPTVWNYDTNSGYANFVGYVRTGGGQSITDPRSLCGY